MRRSKSHAFTLVELLVVIGIIAVLISMLLPALNKARAAANTTKCLANLRSIGQAMSMYVAQNKGFIPGSGNTSGRFLWTVSGSGTCVLANGSWSFSNVPEINDCLDFVGPLARVMGVKHPALTGTDPRARLRMYMQLPQFQCPSYAGVLATPNSSAGTTSEGAQPAFSYNTALAFLNIPFSVYSDGSFSGAVASPGTTGASGYWTLPPGYVPKIQKVGSPSQKVYAADGARRTSATGGQAYGPVYTLTPSISATSPTDNSWADYGPFFASTRSYGRDGLPANNSTTARSADIRVLSFRHGSNRPFSTGGQLRMNMVFYDGHAENMDDVSAANPNYWLPRGTVWPRTKMNAKDSVTGCNWLYTDLAAKYAPGSADFVAQ